ncbi:MAG: hypothetical protein ABSA65_14295 [Acidimicrobiales bacterium]|jgi:hypothetical protein
MSWQFALTFVHSSVLPSDPVQVFMARAALGQVLANLVDNAFFWLIRSKGSGKGGTIEANIERLDHGFA